MKDQDIDLNANGWQGPYGCAVSSAPACASTVDPSGGAGGIRTLDAGFAHILP
jgi:hypothetical protein